MLIDFSDCMGDEEVAVHDPKSNKPVIWGRRITRWLNRQDFDHLSLQHEVVTVMEMDTVYFVVTRKLDWDKLIGKHGQPIQVGLGPRGGFKWVRMTDDTYWSHAQYRKDSQEWAKNYPRFIVKCGKEGESLAPSRRTVGRSGKGNRRKR
jgi:hypothetical protein